MEDKKEIHHEESKKEETKIGSHKIEKSEHKKAEKIVKEKAIVNGLSLQISPKYSYAICKMIKNKTPENAVKILEKVLIKKIAVPMNKLEVPHRRGDIMAGRYPINAVKEFIKLLKQLKANANVNNIEEPVIALAFANRASRPYRRGGKRAKRTNVYIEVKSRIKQK